METGRRRWAAQSFLEKVSPDDSNIKELEERNLFLENLLAEIDDELTKVQNLIQGAG